MILRKEEQFCTEYLVLFPIRLLCHGFFYLPTPECSPFNLPVSTGIMPLGPCPIFLRSHLLHLTSCQPLGQHCLPSSKHVLYCKALSSIPYLVFLQPVLWRFLKFSVHFGSGARNLGPAQPHNVWGHTGICGAPLFFAAPRPISRPLQLGVNYPPAMQISGAC